MRDVGGISWTRQHKPESVEHENVKSHALAHSWAILPNAEFVVLLEKNVRFDSLIT
jgi:hypothetical protein